MSSPRSLLVRQVKQEVKAIEIFLFDCLLVVLRLGLWEQNNHFQNTEQNECRVGLGLSVLVGLWLGLSLELAGAFLFLNTACRSRIWSLGLQITGNMVLKGPKNAQKHQQMENTGTKNINWDWLVLVLVVLGCSCWVEALVFGGKGQTSALRGKNEPKNFSGLFKLVVVTESREKTFQNSVQFLGTFRDTQKTIPRFRAFFGVPANSGEAFRYLACTRRACMRSCAVFGVKIFRGHSAPKRLSRIRKN